MLHAGDVSSPASARYTSRQTHETRVNHVGYRVFLGTLTKPHRAMIQRCTRETDKAAFVYGVGAQYAFTRHFSLQAEYRGLVYRLHVLAVDQALFRQRPGL